MNNSVLKIFLQTINGPNINLIGNNLQPLLLKVIRLLSLSPSPDVSNLSTQSETTYMFNQTVSTSSQPNSQSIPDVQGSIDANLNATTVKKEDIDALLSPANVYKHGDSNGPQVSSTTQDKITEQSNQPLFSFTISHVKEEEDEHNIIDNVPTERDDLVCISAKTDSTVEATHHKMIMNSLPKKIDANGTTNSEIESSTTSMEDKCVDSSQCIDESQCTNKTVTEELTGFNHLDHSNYEVANATNRCTTNTCNIKRNEDIFNDERLQTNSLSTSCEGGTSNAAFFPQINSMKQCQVMLSDLKRNPQFSEYFSDVSNSAFSVILEEDKKNCDTYNGSKNYYENNTNSKEFKDTPDDSLNIFIPEKMRTSDVGLIHESTNSLSPHNQQPNQQCLDVGVNTTKESDNNEIYRIPTEDPNNKLLVKNSSIIFENDKVEIKSRSSDLTTLCVSTDEKIEVVVECEKPFSKQDKTNNLIETQFQQQQKLLEQQQQQNSITEHTDDPDCRSSTPQSADKMKKQKKNSKSKFTLRVKPLLTAKKGKYNVTNSNSEINSDIKLEFEESSFGSFKTSYDEANLNQTTFSDALKSSCGGSNSEIKLEFEESSVDSVKTSCDEANLNHKSFCDALKPNCGDDSTTLKPKKKKKRRKRSKQDQSDSSSRSHCVLTAVNTKKHEGLPGNSTYHQPDDQKGEASNRKFFTSCRNVANENAQENIDDHKNLDLENGKDRKGTKRKFLISHETVANEKPRFVGDVKINEKVVIRRPLTCNEFYERMNSSSPKNMKEMLCDVISNI